MCSVELEIDEEVVELGGELDNGLVLSEVITLSSAGTMLTMRWVVMGVELVVTVAVRVVGCVVTVSVVTSAVVSALVVGLGVAAGATLSGTALNTGVSP